MRFDFWTRKTSKTSNVMGPRPVKSINQSIIRLNTLQQFFLMLQLQRCNTLQATTLYILYIITKQICDS